MRVLEHLPLTRGLPQHITLDNGPEFAGKALDGWEYRRGVTLAFIEPGKPVQNTYMEGFNGGLRDEFLNEHWLTSLVDARQTIEERRADYSGFTHTANSPTALPASLQRKWQQGTPSPHQPMGLSLRMV